MKAKIVVGLGFGDEGKGITTDYLCKKAEGSTIVVRFSGGQQAGHTVQIGNWKHIFSTFGSGTGRNIPTYISEYCTFYPPNALNEYDILIMMNTFPLLTIHPLARLTSYWDVAWNRFLERVNSHGSCGIGVGATMLRQEQSPYKLHFIDLLHPIILEEKLNQIGRYYGEKIKDFKPSMKNYFDIQVQNEKVRFIQSLGSAFMRGLITRGIKPTCYLNIYENIIFEGSQGILLDMEHGIFPNVTYSSTTSKNALQICRQLELNMVKDVDVYFVTRSYLTRHGNGWFPETPVILVNNEQETNTWNEWQRHFRVAELDYSLLDYSLSIDNSYSQGCIKHLIVTCMDQRKKPEFNYVWTNGKFTTMHTSWSPDCKDFKRAL